MTNNGNLPSLTGSDALAMERELHAQSFPDFIRDSWHTLHSPEQPYVHNWHVDAIADHLMAVHRGEITRLLINIPYGMSKSLLSTVMFPAWEWGPGQRPHLSYMCASYEMERLGKRDLGRMRSLVGSDWYQQRYGDLVQIDPKNDTKEKFHNKAGGFRETRPIGGMTGGRADRVIIDDPHSTEGAESEAERERTLRIFSESIPSRLNKPRESAIIVIMQRLHERDVSGHILEQELGYDHLVLPMRFEKDHPYPNKTTLGFTDPRSEEGELLFPERFPESVVASDEQAFGGPFSFAASGQLQQRPEPRGGGLIRVDKIERHSTAPMPGTIRSLVRYWDKACLVAGTQVATGRGDVPIEEVQVGDTVLTRAGYKRVTASWLSKRTDELTTVLLSDGRTLTGTPDHPVFTQDGFWVDLSRMSQSDTLLDSSEVSEWEDHDERILKSGSSTGVATPDTPSMKHQTRLALVTSSAKHGTQKLVDIAVGRYTETSGNTTTAPYPVATISTTRMATGTTTTSRTLNASRPGITGASTRMTSRMRLRSRIRSIEQKHRQAFGLESQSRRSTSASAVGARLLQRVSRLSSVVLAGRRGSPNGTGRSRNPGKRLDDNGVSPARVSLCKGNVATVAQPSWLRTSRLDTALNADMNATRQLVDKAHGGIEPGSVPVYDLTVEDEHEFFANGVLVHNSTAGGGAYTAGVLMARLIDGFTPAYVVIDVVRGQWSAGERDRKIQETAEFDQERWGRTQIYIEQEPGSGGKDSYQATAQQLPGYEVWPDRVTGDKTSRAGGLASQVEAGNVAILDNRPWTLHLFNELEKFPNGRYKDQGDAMAGAFTKLTATGFAGAWGSRHGKKKRS